MGRKIALTSRAMQQATGITEPDYGVMSCESGAQIPFDAYTNVRIEVELAFVLGRTAADVPGRGTMAVSTRPLH